MNNWIVITSINRPTKSIIQLSKIKGWNLVVVGDRKSPPDWSITDCIFLDIGDQESLGLETSSFLPYNHYARKNLGYLYAIKNGATLIWETDDDNILLEPEPKNLGLKSEVSFIDTTERFFNIYQHFTDVKIWPRGFPLDQIDAMKKIQYLDKKYSFIPIQQGLADKDPDVDAIFRLVFGKEKIMFNKDSNAVALPRNTFCPFNSQNTLWHKDSFWGLLLFGSVTSRVCDILRGYWVQRLLWEINGNLVFLPPSVVQNRNVHNLINDFKEEIPLYLNTKLLCNILFNITFESNNMFKNIVKVAVELCSHELIKEIDVELTKAWVHDLRNCGYDI